MLKQMPSMRRRIFLKAILGYSAFAGSGFLWKARSAPPGPVSKRRIVDVHCHFFNAADLPVRGFLERVALADYAASKAQAGSSAGIPVTVWHGMVAKLTELILKQRAPSPKKELEFLRESQEGVAMASRQMVRGLLPQGRAGIYPPRDILTQVLDQRSPGDAPRTRGLAAPQPASTEKAETDEFTDFVRKEMLENQEPVAAERRRGLGAPGPGTRGQGSGAAGQPVAGFIASGRSFFSRYFQWAAILTDYRINIASRYRKLYDPQNERIVLATPALIDFNFWLNDNSSSPLSEQIELMGLLSIRSAFPMHGFAPFDPLREVRRPPGETSSLQIVKQAIRHHGFLGVKLYSPMGFRPSQNAELGFPFPAPAAGKDFGKRLDDALDGLYAWCEKEQVPILAHTTESQSAGPDFAARAEPKFWLSVLEKYPRLRLNLAHFGNFSQAFTGSEAGDPAANYPRTWEHEIGAIVKDGRFRSVFADISYFYWVLDGSGETQKIAAAKRMFAKYFEADAKVERLMFGTDWSMTGKALKADGYIDNVEAFFTDLGLTGAQLDNLFYKNALRYLGLDRETKASGRLKAFYAKVNKPYPNFAGKRLNAA
jgi:predicted TIM-barrel fold metal-dependent hydrolase